MKKKIDVVVTVNNWDGTTQQMQWSESDPYTVQTIGEQYSSHWYARQIFKPLQTLDQEGLRQEMIDYVDEKGPKDAEFRFYSDGKQLPCTCTMDVLLTLADYVEGVIA